MSNKPKLPPGGVEGDAVTRRAMAAGGIPVRIDPSRPWEVHVRLADGTWKRLEAANPADAGRAVPDGHLGGADASPRDTSRFRHSWAKEPIELFLRTLRRAPADGAEGEERSRPRDASWGFVDILSVAPDGSTARPVVAVVVDARTRLIAEVAISLPPGDRPPAA